MRKTFTLAAATVITGLALASCTLGDTPGGVEKGSLAGQGDLSGTTLTVGSKEFTEQLVLCEIAALALESAGAEVERSCGMSGSATVRQALLSGDIDLYWEYTGTGWITHLKQTQPITDPQQQYEAVAKADQEQNGVHWLEPAQANNTYAIATTEKKAAELGVNSISDYAQLATSDPAKASFCGASEFFGREDGWPGVQKAYDFTLPSNRTAELAVGAIYNSIAQGKPCAFGEVFVTDGRIAALNLKVLEDDKKFFAVYNPALTIGKHVADKQPALAAVMAPVTKALDNQTLRVLNAKVDVEGETPERVAEEWMREKGFIK
ncbi:glycine betaine ABC transporter substrate-binding protein [Thermostaphylospora chromogena]|uniref:Osmoprotectant transport system substrate-binding protein n=1 Tax=Thermostaphylospora chromogena TaxID=35622 RepID=A0A1H1CZB8_9ACTN|nr:glycine betaine ABC transporter substrate-binding protein [Thermostaphylospora chromogena]SDQ69573.1 osmoprotectant transport system substrate-binding protein [Thermostaphylospora chromogena]